MAEFVHLHVHSHYSLLEATPRPAELAERAAEMGMPALALTDHGNMFGAVEFHLACRKAGVKPILGCELYVAPRSVRDKDVKNKWHRLTVLARNNDGYHNLARLVSAGWLEGFWYRPRVDWELLEQHAAGLFALSGNSRGEVMKAVRAGDLDAACAAAERHADLFGRDHYRLEAMDHGADDQRAALEGLAEVSERTGIPVVATNDVHYLEQDDAQAHDALLCIADGARLTDQDRRRLEPRRHWLRTPDEMAALFADRPEWLTGTVEVAEACDVELDFDTPRMPRFQGAPDDDNEAHFRRLCMEGLERHYGSPLPDAVTARFDYEAGVIQDMGFTDYFLIVWDFIRRARELGVPVGPGRGSAAGSIVAYALDITAVDPLEHGLIFERFLNPGRNEMPDIDIDFCREGRERIIEYVRDKYGRDSVCQIITFGTMKARAAIRDVGRVLDMPLPEVDRLAKMVPETLGITLQEALEQEPDLKEAYDERHEVHRLVDTAMRLEGQVRHPSIHAAGVVIADRPLTELVPLHKAGEDVTTQYEMSMLEKLGLLKMDFLGLKTLTLIDRACDLVEQRTGDRPDIENLPLHDAETYALLSRGESKGVFQLESAGMRELLGKMRPDRFDDLVAILALYRPGPLNSGMVDRFVDCKHGRQEVTYIHPVLEPILRETYGVIVYQEQVMRIAAEMAGFDLSDADRLRKAMGKKIKDLMAEFQEMFVEGAVERGVERAIADEVWRLMAEFAEYGFNKSHTVAYGLVSWQTAWLKTHHPTDFMAALLSVEMENSDKLVEYLDECARMDIPVLPPDVQHSHCEFTVETTDDGRPAIRHALGAIKGVGRKAADSIVEARTADGPFRDLFDLCERVDLRLNNKAVLEALVKGGAMDSIAGDGGTRAGLAASLEDALQVGSAAQRDRQAGQGGLFSDMDAGPADAPTPPTRVPEWESADLLRMEKEALGCWYSSHPLETHRSLVRSLSTHAIPDLAELPEGTPVTVGGLLTKVETRTVRSGRNAGRKMGVLHLDDMAGSVPAVAFSRTWEDHRDRLAADTPVFLVGRTDRRADEINLIVDDVVTLEEAPLRLTHVLRLDLPARRVGDDLLQGLDGVLERHRGGVPLYVRVATDRGTAVIRAGRDRSVAPTAALLDELTALLGREAVRPVPTTPEAPQRRGRGRGAVRSG